jgi:hypothetical protein
MGWGISSRAFGWSCHFTGGGGGKGVGGFADRFIGVENRE